MITIGTLAPVLLVLIAGLLLYLLPPYLYSQITKWRLEEPKCTSRKAHRCVYTNYVLYFIPVVLGLVLLTGLGVGIFEWFFRMIVPKESLPTFIGITSSFLSMLPLYAFLRDGSSKDQVPAHNHAQALTYVLCLWLTSQFILGMLYVITKL